MTPHETAARIAAQEHSPRGLMMRNLLADLDKARADSIWAQAIAEHLEDRITLGGIPAPYTADWRNPDLPVGVVHADYRGRL